MAEDPTRIMGPDDDYERRRRPPQKPHGNMRLVVAIMGAVIFGLFIALLVSGGGGETKTVTVKHTVTIEEPAKTTGNGGAVESAEEKEAKEAEEAAEEESEPEENGEAEEGETSGGVSPAELQEIEEIDRGEIENPAPEEGTIEGLPEEEGTGGGGLGTG